jgi:GNAT superfamily N-acetyltransferase
VDLQIALATPADRDAVVATVVAAFVGDPAYRYFFPDDASYPTYAAAYTGYLFDKRVGLGGVFTAADAAVTAIWEPRTEPSRPAPAGEPDLPADAWDRIERYDAIVEPLLPPDPHWYLGLLATHPSHAGRRLGRRLMAAGVSAAHEAGVPAVLETTNPSNVDLYRGEGWRVVAQAGGLGGVPHTWVLVKSPEESQ